jgi:hypothetical protein
MKTVVIFSFIFVFLISLFENTTPKLQIGDGGLISGKPCSAPCFLNIIPGMTLEKESLNILGTLGNIDNCDRWDAVKNGIEKGIGCDNVWIYFNDEDIVSELSIKSSQRITVQQILDRYGDPDAVYVSAEGISLKGPEKMDLIYSRYNLVVGLAPQNNKYYDVSPTTTTQRVLYSDRKEFSRFIGSFNQFWHGYGKYFYGNPLPVSGYAGNISENDSQEAQNIVNILQFYGIDILVDWGTKTQTFEFNDPHNGGRIGSQQVTSWQQGKWTLNELYIVLAAVQNLDSVFHHHLKEVLGSVQISLVDPLTLPENCNDARGCTIGNNVELADHNLPPQNPPDPAYLATYNIIEGQSVNNFDQWTVVHELAHVWENHYAEINNQDPFLYLPLSEQLVMKTGGQYSLSGSFCLFHNWRPGCNISQYFYGAIPEKGVNNNFSPQEDFAESVAAYVFPAAAQRLIENVYGDNSSANIEQKRLLYYPDYSITLRRSIINSLVINAQE